jgi:hypothetical protein
MEKVFSKVLTLTKKTGMKKDGKFFLKKRNGPDSKTCHPGTSGLETR